MENSWRTWRMTLFRAPTITLTLALQHAYTLLVYWKQDPKNVVRLIGGIGDGLSFMNLGHQSGTQKEVICYKCKKKGHVVRNCPEGKDDEGGGEDESEDMTATQLAAPARH
jgi:Zinc knuckle